MKAARGAHNSRAHHSAYLGIRALEAARGAVFAEIPRFCNLIIVRVSSVMAG